MNKRIISSLLDECSSAAVGEIIGTDPIMTKSERKRIFAESLKKLKAMQNETETSESVFPTDTDYAEHDNRPFIIRYIGYAAGIAVLFACIGSTFYLLRRAEKEVVPEIVTPVMTKVTTEITTEKSTSVSAHSLVTSAVSALSQTSEKTVSSSETSAETETTAVITEQIIVTTETVTEPVADIPNEIVLSKSVLSESITAENTVIPSGAAEITVQIKNSTGFEFFEKCIQLGSAYSVITDNCGLPVIKAENMLNNSAVCGMLNGSTLSVVSVSDEEITEDGALFTFYAEDSGNGDTSVNISDVPYFESAVPPFSSLSAINEKYVKGIHSRGDLDENGYIDESDALLLLKALKRYNAETGQTEIPMNEFTANGTIHSHDIEYFADSKASPTQADADSDGYISKADAKEILRYYLSKMNNAEYTGRVGQLTQVDLYTSQELSEMA